MKITFKFLSIVLVTIFSTFSSCRNDNRDDFETTNISQLTNKQLLDATIQKNAEILGLFFENGNFNDVKNLTEKLNSTSNEDEKIKALQVFFGNDYLKFQKEAYELKALDNQLQSRNLSKEEKLKAVEAFNFSALNNKIVSSSSITARNKPAYDRCCAMVVASAVVMGTGCSALTAGIGTVICVAGAVAYEAAGIGNCADTWL